MKADNAPILHPRLQNAPTDAPTAHPCTYGRTHDAPICTHGCTHSANRINSSILRNERYKGDARLQKSFCTDYLTKKFKKSEGEVPQYYVKNSHPAIIDSAMFDAVQVEMDSRAHQRAQYGNRNYTPHTFSGRIYCGECGGLCGSNMSHNHYIWRCNNHHRKKTQRQTPSIRNQVVEDAFVAAINRAIEQKDEIISICEKVISDRCETTEIDTGNCA